MKRNKITIEVCQELAKNRNGLCLSLIYKSSKTLMLWECKDKHQWQATFSHIKYSNSWCPYHSGRHNNDLDLCYKVAAIKDGRCLSQKYTNNHTKMLWKCANPNHRSWFMTLNAIKEQGYWCPECSHKKKHYIEECIEYATKMSGKCLSPEYINNKTYMEWQCANGHIFMRKFNAKIFRWCLKCSDRFINVDKCHKAAAEHNGECLNNIYSPKNKIKWKCKCGHIWDATYSNVKHNDSWCPKCMVSKPQEDLNNVIKRFNFITSFNNRDLIAPKELDIFIPDKNIAIEYCGLHWHGEKLNGKEAKYKHLNKLKLCQQKNIRLITIFEDEWLLKNDQVVGYLKAILGKCENKIDVHKCEIKQVDNQIAKQFHIDNNIQGSSNGKHLGLFFNDELIVLSTFAKPSASRKNNENKIELVKYTVKINYSVSNGLSRLLKHYLIGNDNIKEVISYSDNRWSEGNIYKNLGFDFINSSNPSYFYFKSGKSEKHHRYNFTKHKALELFGGDPNIDTEWSIMERNGYDRIWDCGSSKWALKIR